jgi:rare lipoprotein A
MKIKMKPTVATDLTQRRAKPVFATPAAKALKLGASGGRIFGIAIAAILLCGCGSKQTVVYKKESPKEVSEIATRPSASFKHNMQPYTVFGKKYEPAFVSIGDEFGGTASWYGPDFHGKSTANGEIYDMHADTAAHNTLPINTMVKVTNQNNGISTVVRINDRGPFVEGRIIDLSYNAGKRLGLDKTGTATVRLVVVGFDGLTAKSAKKMEPTHQAVAQALTQEKEKEKRAVSNYAIQIGAFKANESAQRFASENATVDGVYKSVVKEYGQAGQKMYRVFLGGFRSEAEARDFLKKERFKGAFIMSLD